MDLSLFDYSFPKELVAQHPLPRREDSRMMVVDRKTGDREHRRFPDLLEYLRAGDLLVLNDAEADPVEFEGRRVPPLPPYIKRKKAEDFTEEDFQRYRTVYAKAPGSTAAPTAGFHFTEKILERIGEVGVEIRSLTLHVSYDTYKPIRNPQIEDHVMHGEEYLVPPETAEAILRAKKGKRRIVAVGTTVVRALESWRCGIAGKTNLFITPGFEFRIVDALLTNFHRPRSTVLVMVSAFAGRDLILAAYEEAILEKYRLFSYGDCMLII
jgi:S-adenosylmethionine:tRNA ribosyltransferase-isomerase